MNWFSEENARCGSIRFFFDFSFFSPSSQSSILLGVSLLNVLKKSALMVFCIRRTYPFPLDLGITRIAETPTKSTHLKRYDKLLCTDRTSLIYHPSCDPALQLRASFEAVFP